MHDATLGSARIGQDGGHEAADKVDAKKPFRSPKSKPYTLKLQYVLDEYSGIWKSLARLFT